jgi:DNA-binding response OmpR family regulator
MGIAAADRGGRILVVEDEPKIAALVARSLEAAGCAITTVGTGLGALKRVRKETFDLVILDLLLPDLHGISVLRHMLELAPEQQVLVLSALSDPQSKVQCLELGACDYLAKPFDLGELLVRVRIRLGGHNGNGTHRYLRVGSLTLDLQRRVVTANGRCEAPLAGREFLLLEYLMRKAGDVATRDELLLRVWEYPFDPGTNVVDVCVARLRHKLGGNYIETVRNVGYCFVGA